MKSIKLLLGTVICISLMLSLFTAPAQAAWRDYKFHCAKLTEKPVLDGVINEGEYGDSSWINLDASVDGGAWATNAGDEVKASYIFAWMDDGVYVGIKIENDMTPNQNGPADSIWWGFGDMVQIFFNPGYLITEGSPVLFNIGLNKNAKPVTSRQGHNGAELTDENRETYITSKIDGYSAEWKNGVYCVELFIPWSEILVKGMDRDNVKVTDLTGWKPAPGAEIGIMVVYCDIAVVSEANDGSLNEFAAYRSDVSGGWSAEEMGSIVITLGDAPAPVAVPEDVPAATEESAAAPPAASAPKTGDSQAVMLVFAMLFTCAVFAVTLKSRRKFR